MHNVSRHERVRPLLRTRVVLEVICSVDDGNAVFMAVGGERQSGGRILAVLDPSVVGATELGWTTAQQERDKRRKVFFDNYL